jgi:hypothetical protein
MHTQTAHQHSPISLWRTHNLEKQTKTANSAVDTKENKYQFIGDLSSDAIFAAVCVMRNCRAHKVNSALWQNVKIPLKEKATIGAHRKRAQR